MDRLQDLIRFYEIMDRLSKRLGGPRPLAGCNGRQNWPQRGVYFFFEAGETRSHSGTGPRVVRVGTHAITSGVDTSLWNRLSQHRGTAKSGGGNHRGSIFRSLVGSALQQAPGVPTVRSWGHKQDLAQAARSLGGSIDKLRAEELPLELAVSKYIGAMPFLWINVPDAPSRDSLRSVIERGAIALLSNWQKPALDPPSKGWLGSDCNRDAVRRSGLWNVNHVDEAYDRAFLGVMEECVSRS
jgi:hypothetical protein